MNIIQRMSRIKNIEQQATTQQKQGDEIVIVIGTIQYSALDYSLSIMFRIFSLEPRFSRSVSFSISLSYYHIYFILILSYLILYIYIYR